MESQIYYRPANQATADYLQHCLGCKSDHAHSETLREGTETTEGRTEQGIPLMTAQDIKQLKTRISLDFIASYRPLEPIVWTGDTFPLLCKDRQCQRPSLRRYLSLMKSWRILQVKGLGNRMRRRIYYPE
jgi:hypothetical protein